MAESTVYTVHRNPTNKSENINLGKAIKNPLPNNRTVCWVAPSWCLLSGTPPSKQIWGSVMQAPH